MLFSERTGRAPVSATSASQQGNQSQQTHPCLSKDPRIVGKCHRYCYRSNRGGLPDNNDGYYRQNCQFFKTKMSLTLSQTIFFPTTYLVYCVSRAFFRGVLKTMTILIGLCNMLFITGIGAQRLGNKDDFSCCDRRYEDVPYWEIGMIVWIRDMVNLLTSL